ncbi:DUF711 family protein [Streptococcus equi]|uniref:DUF711 family protein n=1 Tax=Streptococcus equi TaxID=1336 RepID=UPI0022AB69DC|nr:DUF711 family protein [Streptococcus equi]
MRSQRRHRPETIAAMIADEAAIGVINQKTTAVRIIPKGKEGDMIAFGGLLGTAPVMAVNPHFIRLTYCSWWANACPYP